MFQLYSSYEVPLWLNGKARHVSGTGMSLRLIADGRKSSMSKSEYDEILGSIPSG